MKFKRFMALALAGVMTLGMASNVFADPTGESEAAEQAPYDEVSINKSVQYNTGVDITDVKHEFTFNFAPINNEPSLDSVTISFTGDEGKTLADTIAEKLNVESQLTALGEYDYTLTETSVGRDENGAEIPTEEWLSDATRYKFVVFITNGGENENGTMKKVYQYAIWGLDEAGKPTVKQDNASFTNTYKPIAGNKEQGSLTLTKDVVGEEWSDTNTYNFTVTFTDGQYTKIEDFEINGGIGTDIKPIEVKAGSAVEISLKKGETYKFEGIPQGTQYTIVEDSSTYGKYFKAEDTEINGSDEMDVSKLQASGTLGKDTEAVNYKNIFESGITPTGLALNIAPFIAMFAAVGAAIALYVAAKRRVR